jgi:hypothetical protein
MDQRGDDFVVFRNHDVEIETSGRVKDDHVEPVECQN